MRVLAEIELHLFRIYVKALRSVGQLTPEEELELLVKQIVKLWNKGWDQAKIRNELVGSGLYSSDVFEKAWKEALRYMKPRERGSFFLTSQRVYRSTKDLDKVWMDLDRYLDVLKAAPSFLSEIESDIKEEIEDVSEQIRNKEGELKKLQDKVNKAKTEEGVSELSIDELREQQRLLSKELESLKKQKDKLTEKMKDVAFLKDNIDRLLGMVKEIEELVGTWLDFEYGDIDLTESELERLVLSLRDKIQGFKLDLFKKLESVLKDFGLDVTPMAYILYALKKNVGLIRRFV